MTHRSMIDCTHANLPTVLRGTALAPDDLVACYVSGSPGIRWTDADLAEVQGHVLVTIDQGGDGSPVPDATVRDVEAGAWSVAAAIDRSGWHAARPTIYLSSSRLGELAAAGWDGDVWVADWDQLLPPLPTGAKFSLVAWQWANFGTYDASTVFDPDWPNPAPAPTTWQETAMQALPTIRQGATGEAVRTAQALCIARGEIIACDGAFGPATKAAVEHLQQVASIASDGIVGPHTWPVLMGVN